MTDEELIALADKVRGRCIPDGSGCQLWQGARDRKGYGSLSHNGRRWSAHRAAYTGTKGPIPEGLHIDHLCRKPSCCNPDHLEAVTPLENVRRGVAGQHRQISAQAITACPRGHEYTPDNTYICKRGKRSCKACTRALSNERRRAKYAVDWDCRERARIRAMRRSKNPRQPAAAAIRALVAERGK